ncbi:hypothetical protein N9018_03350, partial [Rhodopirellula sp.]|nr:hypothetical protein [Rhodopirellula sp.]
MIAHLIPSKAILPFATLVWFVLSPALWNAAHCQTVENNAVQPDAADTKSNSQILRVLSYNIHHAAGTDGKLDLQRIANVIQSVDPDVISLQEVDRLARRSGSVDQPSELARLTG